MYLRFETDQKDPDLGIHRGMFQMAYEILKSDEILEEDRIALEENLDWFNTNLPIAKKYKRGRRDRARCWIKDNQRDAIAKMHELKSLLESMGVPVQLFTTQNPGYITWEDDFQVAAVPFKSKSKS